MDRKEWVPDEEGTGCSLCHSEFSITKRRHHCRKCGALVCGSCSDHFVILPGTSSEVRLCDSCEISFREASGASEKMDVTSQITVSLKQALKDKARESEIFSTFLAHILDNSELESPSSASKLAALQSAVESICKRLREATEHYNDLKMSSVELEREIRAVAQRCIKAEELTREGLTITREIEEYSSRIGSQARLIDQLTERVDRLSNPARSPEASSMRRVGTENRHVVTRHVEPNHASVCEVLKSLLTL